jgi:tetratricopeptide (TPR) repeat protein
MKQDRARLIFGMLLVVGLGGQSQAQADAAKDAYQEGVRLVREGQLRVAITSFDKAIRLKPDYAEAYNARGIAHDNLAQFERALKDYDEAIRLNPGYVEAYYNRANAYSDAGQYEESLKDYTEVIRLNPGYAEAYHNRALASIASAQSEAASDARVYLELRGWKEKQSLYMVLIGYFGDRRARHDTVARRLLDEAVTKADTTFWPYPIIRYLRGEITVDALLAAAQDTDQRTEARAYAGLYLSLSGQRDAALPHLRWVKENGNKRFIEYALAVNELDRLESVTQAQP